MEVLIQIRHRMQAVPGRIKLKDDDVLCHFRDPVKAVAEGQVLAVYDGLECLGSGVIIRTEGGEVKVEQKNKQALL